MSEESGINWQELQKPLDPAHIEWRVRKKGTTDAGRPWAKVVPFPDARRLQDRLDEVAGPGNWRDEYDQGPAGGVLCRLSIRNGSGWVSKEDGAQNTDIEEVKGGLTDAFKRACVKWNVCGIRALYRVGTCWAQFHEDGRYDAKIGDSYHSWDPPEIQLSEAGATVSHKRNGDREQTEVESEIGSALATLKQWNRERAKKAEAQYQALDTSDEEKAREFLQATRKAVAQEERKAEKAERDKQGA